MLPVGLTGSIAVGKSFVTSVFGELGCHTIDADKIAREVVEPGTAGLAAVVEAFGPDILTSDGRLDRSRLGAVVFEDEGKRQLLNSIMHPYILRRQDEILRQLDEKDPGGIVIVDAALMIESGGFRRFDKLIVVYCAPSLQLERLMKREGISRDQAERKIAAQMSQEDKLKFANYRIDTSGDYDATRKQVEQVYKQLKHKMEKSV